MGVIIKCVLQILILGILCVSNAQGRTLLLVNSDTKIYHDFIAGFKNEVKSKALVVDVQTLETAKPETFKLYDVVVVAGLDAAKALVGGSVNGAKVVYTLLPQSSYQWLKENNQLLSPHRVIFIDQPPERYVQLLKVALPELSSFGALMGDASKTFVPELRKAAEKYQLKFVEEYVQPKTKLTSQLKDIMYASDALLLLPDPYLYNRRAVQQVLLAGFRFKRPLIAYSESYIQAGALLAVFSTPEQIGRQAAEVVKCIDANCDGGFLPKVHYPRYFTVQTNDSVARQLGLSIKPADELEKLLQ